MTGQRLGNSPFSFFKGLWFAAALLGAGCASQSTGMVERSEPESSPQQLAMIPPTQPTYIPPNPQTLPPPNVAPSVTPPVPVMPNYPRTIQDSGTNPAVISLYRTAQQQQSGGHADLAHDTLQRAEHIDPRNPFVWQALAGVCMSLNQPDQAVAAARKSNSLARGNPFVEAGNYRLIASALQALGDASGAQDAQARADDIARTISP